MRDPQPDEIWGTPDEPGRRWYVVNTRPDGTVAFVSWIATAEDQDPLDHMAADDWRTLMRRGVLVKRSEIQPEGWMPTGQPTVLLDWSWKQPDWAGIAEEAKS